MSLTGNIGQSVNSSEDLALDKRRMSMAIVDGVEQKPDLQQQQSGAGDTTIQQPRNDGNRADTSRVVDAKSGVPQDGDQRKGVDGKVYTFKEDRGSWVPPHRLSEETGKRTKAETEAAQLRQDLDIERKRVRAALGVETLNKDDAELQETRELFFKTFPEFGHLKDLSKDDIAELLDAAREARGSANATWARHREEMRAELDDVAAELLRTDKLTEQQSKRLWRAFREEAREQAQARAKAERAEDSTYDFENDFVARYERGDKTLLEEFAKSFNEEWVTPARRTATAAVVTRGTRPVPRGERTRPAITQGPPNINYNDDDAFKKAMGAARSGGGEV